MSWCINPKCAHRNNPGDFWQDSYAERRTCQECGTPLLIQGRYFLIKPLCSLERPDSYNDIFEVQDQRGTSFAPAGSHLILKVLKYPDPKRVELIQREAAMLKVLGPEPGSPRCDVDGYFSLKLNNGIELHCLVMEKIKGLSLEQWLGERGVVSELQALEWLMQALKILQRCHQLYCFHRDIKPSNIMIQPDGNLVLIDWGTVREITDTYLARISSGLSRAYRQDRDTTAVISPGYSPGEQIRGKALPQSDLYSLGVTFIQALTGRHPVDLAEDPETGKLLWRELSSQISQPLVDLLDWMTQPMAAHRPQNAELVLDYLNQLRAVGDRRPGRIPTRSVFPIQETMSNRGGLSPVRGIPPRSRLILLVFLAMGFAIGMWTGTRWLSRRAFEFNFEQGSRALDRGELQQAKVSLQQAAELNPQHLATANNLALACLGLGDFGCAQKNFRKALKLQPHSWQVYRNLGDLYERMHDYPAAVAAYERAIALGGKAAVGAKNDLARLNVILKDYEQAIALARQGLAETTVPAERSALYKNLGWALLEQGQLSEAEAALEQATRLDPNRSDAWCFLARAAESLKHRTSAQTAWGRCYITAP